MFFDIEKFYDSACLYKLVDHAMAMDFPRRLLYIAMQACLSERILRAGDMVGQSIQPSSGILAGCSLGNRFARVIFHKILDSVNNVLPAQLPAPVETRQFVDDLATMSAANNEDDVTRSICSIALELRHELEAPKLTLDKNKSMIVSNRKSLAKRVQRILRVNDLHIPVADATRDLGINAVGGARRRRTRNLRLRAARRRGSRVKVLAWKNRKAVSGVLGSRQVPKSSGTSAPLHFLQVAPFLGRKQRHASACTEGVEACPLQTPRRKEPMESRARTHV